MSRANQKWDTELDLRDLWKEFDNGGKGVIEVAKELAKRLREHKLAEQLKFCAEEFENISMEYVSGDDDALEAFDECMYTLYNIADQNKQCWVRTGF